MGMIYVEFHCRLHKEMSTDPDLSRDCFWELVSGDAEVQNISTMHLGNLFLFFHSMALLKKCKWKLQQAFEYLKQYFVLFWIAFGRLLFWF